MTKRKFNPVANLLGFVNLSWKKRKTGKRHRESKSQPDGQENIGAGSTDNRTDTLRDASIIAESWKEPSSEFIPQSPAMLSFSMAMEQCDYDIINAPMWFDSDSASIPVAAPEECVESVPTSRIDAPSHVTHRVGPDEDGAERQVSAALEEEETENGEIDDSDDEAPSRPKKPGKFDFPPSLEEVQGAYRDLTNILKPPKKSKKQAYKDPGLDGHSKKRLEDMQTFCRVYIKLLEENPPNTRGLWQKASLETSIVLGHSVKGSKRPGERRSHDLRKWIREFIQDREEVPLCNWKTTGRSLIDDEDLAQEIHAHLQSLKPSEVCAEAIIRFINNPEMLARLQRKKTISLCTAQRWMHKMEYRWTYDPKGQYVDGHERSDVTDYRKNVFLPAMAKLYPRMSQWSSKDGPPTHPDLTPGERRVVVWYHDESTFYAHDRRRKRWVHSSETAKPYKKGEGASLMVADFFSAEYGWLASRCGKKCARVLFKAGKAREGYFDNDDIRKQLAIAMDILTEDYPDEDHVFVFDNAKTHTKRAEGALSALKMPKGPSPNFMVEVNDLGLDGKLQYKTDGKILKKKVPMSNGRFNDGTEQEFYHPPGHTLAGQFKGMAAILEERGIGTSKLKAQCGKKFSDCAPGRKDCCCRRTLYNQPDFVNVESLLDADTKARGFGLILLPKFHCELNPIEQCWGYAKRNYRLLPMSSSEEDLEKNVVTCLDEIPLITMRRFVT
ncbi:hypothetical protein NLJ89_g8370 [Agrocybe chaxingu]|uniref:Uncharacterized protein n=1 Tax=Agrocybe chaxingu TaxID=84603 RepID=A0A9W8JV12_9AGAR|nr:hypothetical protein NLJ89_g8370 [Agrocybe chaxingu]